MNLDIYADKPARPAKRTAQPKPAKPASKRAPKSLYDVAVRNGWGPQVRLMRGMVDKLKKMPP